MKIYIRKNLRPTDYVIKIFCFLSIFGRKQNAKNLHRFLSGKGGKIVIPDKFDRFLEFLAEEYILINSKEDKGKDVFCMLNQYTNPFLGKNNDDLNNVNEFYQSYGKLRVRRIKDNLFLIKDLYLFYNWCGKNEHDSINCDCHLFRHSHQRTGMEYIFPEILRDFLKKFNHWEFSIIIKEDHINFRYIRTKKEPITEIDLYNEHNFVIGFNVGVSPREFKITLGQRGLLVDFNDNLFKDKGKPFWSYKFVRLEKGE